MSPKMLATILLVAGAPATGLFAGWQHLTMVGMVALMGLLATAFLAGGLVIIASGPEVERKVVSDEGKAPATAGQQSTPERGTTSLSYEDTL